MVNRPKGVGSWEAATKTTDTCGLLAGKDVHCNLFPGSGVIARGYDVDTR